MSGLDPAVAAWLRKAENDLKNIRASLQSCDPAWDTVCYHAQQAAEKMLKAFLVAHGVLPPRVHDLEELLSLCKDFDPSLDEFAGDCGLLTDYGVEVRYPDVTEPDEPEARLAVTAAERICGALQQRLRQP
ncbi:MAG: HEPN domain-containing protein [Verrucomicrobia bacterium]|nr:HEPN domain-containing protein [Verrucomicrobiota bacterium]